MRLPGRIKAVIDVLDNLDRQHRPPQLVLKDWGTANRFAGSGDRRFIASLMGEALRQRGRSRWLFGTESSRADTIGALIFGWQWSLKQIISAFDGSRFSASPLTPDEVAAIETHDLSQAPLAARLSLPPHLARLISKEFGDQAYEEAEAFTQTAPLDLRLNPSVCDRPSLLTSLSEEKAESLPALPLGIRLMAVYGDEAPPYLEGKALFQKGGFEVQDAGSQAISQLAVSCNPRHILDLCAGGGGKSLAVKALLGNKADIHLYDQDPRRLAGFFARQARVGAEGFVIHEPLKTAHDLPSSLLEAAPFDLVIVDAPCTGSGIWRRRPHTKWKLTEKQIQARQTEQDEVLTTAAKLTAKNSHIAYMTCSLFSSENDERIEHFCQTHPGMEPLPVQALAERPPLDKLAFWPRRHGLMLTPARSGTDGFYFSLIRKTV